MAATVDKAAGPVTQESVFCTFTQLSALTAGLDENISHGGPSGVKPLRCSVEVSTRPTDGSVLDWFHDSANDSTTNNTARMRFYCTVGGSLAGAVVRIFFYFNQAASGGIG